MIHLAPVPLASARSTAVGRVFTLTGPDGTADRGRRALRVRSRLRGLWVLAIPGLALAAETHIVYPAADLPSFGLTTSMSVDLMPPFVAPEVLDRGKVTAEVRIPGSSPGQPVRILTPALVQSVDQLAHAYTLAPGVRTVTHDDHCVRVVSDSLVDPFTVDCVARTATQVILCSYDGGEWKALEAAEALCRSMAIR